MRFLKCTFFTVFFYGLTLFLSGGLLSADKKTIDEAPVQQQWNLKDADIRAVIQTVSFLTKKNFIVDPQVKGNITFVSQKAMTPAEIYQAFLAMLQVLDYVAIPSGRVIKIVPTLQARGYSDLLLNRSQSSHRNQVVVQVLPINHVSASQLVPVVRSMMEPWASVSAYVPSNSLILVGSADSLSRLTSVIHRMDSQSANLTSIIHLRHASAKSLVSILKSLQVEARSEGRIVNVAMEADPESNSILVNGNTENIARTKYLIQRLDKRVVGGNTRVIHLNYLESKKLAPMLLKVATGEGATAAGGKNAMGEGAGISVQAEQNNNSIVLHGPVEMLQNLAQVVRQLDVRPSQVLVEAIIVKVDQTLLNQLGIVWGTVDSTGASTSVVDPTTGVAVDRSSGGGTLSTPNTFAMRVTHGIGFISGGNLGVLIHALKSHTSSNILATPSIVVLNNKEATIADGKNIGIVNRQYSSTVPSSNSEITPFNTIQRQDVTLSLKVTPQISPNSIIRLKIQQQSNSIDPSSMGGIENPVLDVSKITTNVLVRSGDILVLGGLINDNHVTGMQKLPILGDIPLLGALFRYKSHRIEKQNLMVFIKPIILNDRLQANNQTQQRYRYIRSEQLALFRGRRLKKRDWATLPTYHERMLLHKGAVFLPPPSATE